MDGFRRVVVLTLAFATFVAVGVSSVAGAVEPKSGAYSGKTSQGNDVSFTVQGNKVKNAEFTLQSGPCEGSFFFPGEIGKVNDKGKFSLSTSLATLRGKFVSKTKATGKATGEFQSCPGGTMTVDYTVKRG